MNRPQRNLNVPFRPGEAKYLRHAQQRVAIRRCCPSPLYPSFAWAKPVQRRNTKISWLQSGSRPALVEER